MKVAQLVTQNKIKHYFTESAVCHLVVSFVKVHVISGSLDQQKLPNLSFSLVRFMHLR